ncbi:MAG: nuclear transport factor 2 family protein [Acidobacteriaceae bacterium]
MPLSAGRPAPVRERWRFPLLLVLLLCACTSGAAHAKIFPLPHHDDHLRKEIEGLESEWREALLQNNAAVFDRLLADDYLGITPNGMLETKADALAVQRSGSVKISQLDPSRMKVRVYGDTAVVTSRAEVTGTNGDRDISGEYRYTRVYNRRSGQWKIVSFEANRISPGKKH